MITVKEIEVSSATCFNTVLILRVQLHPGLLSEGPIIRGYEKRALSKESVKSDFENAKRVRL